MISNDTRDPQAHTAEIWWWEEAFHKFGFDDGDGEIRTDAVADALRAQGYSVDIDPGGIHNVIISEIRRDGVSLIPADAHLGYDNPRDYLPAEAISILDEAFPNDIEYAWP